MTDAAETTLPCGHERVASLFSTTSDDVTLILHPPLVEDDGRQVASAIVWCVPCTAWLPITAEQYSELYEVGA